MDIDAEMGLGFNCGRMGGHWEAGDDTANGAVRVAWPAPWTLKIRLLLRKHKNRL